MARGQRVCVCVCVYHRGRARPMSMHVQIKSHIIKQLNVAHR